MCRRKSPSVTMPSNRRWSSTTQVMPSRLLFISWMTSGIGVSRPTRRDARRPASISDSTRMSFWPRRPPGCRSAKWSASKPLRCDKRHRQGIAERERRGRAGRRRQVHRTRFFGDVAAQRHVGRLAERRLRVPGHRDQPRADAPNRLEQPDELVGLAAVRQRDAPRRRIGRRRGRRERPRRRAGRSPACRCSTAWRRSCAR